LFFVLLQTIQSDEKNESISSLDQHIITYVFFTKERLISVEKHGLDSKYLKYLNLTTKLNFIIGLNSSSTVKPDTLKSLR